MFADECVYTHKTALLPVSVEKPHSVQPSVGENAKSSTSEEVRECYYCHKRGHVIVNCLSFLFVFCVAFICQWPLETSSLFLDSFLSCFLLQFTDFLFKPFIMQ